MSEINVLKVLDELKGKVDEYDVKPLMLKSIRSEFYKTHGVYPDEHTINLKETIEATSKDLVSRYTTVYGDMETARLFYQFHPHQYAFRASENSVCVSNDLILHHYSNLSNSSILEIVKYGINGKFDKDLAEINKLLDTCVPRISYYNRMWLLTLPEKVSIKSFKNGKVTVTGLTTEMKKRIVDGFGIVEKYRNASLFTL
jgi:hypothetical protein